MYIRVLVELGLVVLLSFSLFSFPILILLWLVRFDNCVQLNEYTILCVYIHGRIFVCMYVHEYMCACMKAYNLVCMLVCMLKKRNSSLLIGVNC